MTYDGKKVLTEDGTDVSEAVATIFDLVTGSMDWGSGMLDTEEMIEVIEFAIKMGWTPPTPPENTAPMVQLAMRYPEHYDVYERTDSYSGVTRTFHAVVNKGAKPYQTRTEWYKVSAEVSDAEEGRTDE